MSRYTYVEHPVEEVLHPAVFDFSVRITQKQRVDVYKDGKFVSAFVHNQWRDCNNNLVRCTSDEVQS